MHWIQDLLIGDNLAGLIFALAVASAAGIALGHRKVKGLSLGLSMVMFAGILYGHLCWQGTATTAYARDQLEAQAALHRSHGAAAPVTGAPGTASPAAVAVGAGVEAAAPEPAITQAQVDTRAAAITARRGVVLGFLRDFGLVLFVYAVGMSVGPGFLGSMRAEGLKWNALAAFNVLGSVGVAALAAWWFAPQLLGVAGTVGTLSGAITNTPGLSAAQQALADLARDPAAMGIAATAFAVAYPFGMLGKLIIMLAFRALFRIDFAVERERFERSSGRPAAPANQDFEVVNPAMAGKCIHEVLERIGDRAVISRIRRDGVVRLADHQEPLRLGDAVHAVGPADALDRLHELLGARSSADLRTAPGTRLVSRRVMVTNGQVVGRRVGTLSQLAAYGVNITRVSRAGIEFVAVDDLALNMADTVTVVGPEEAVEKVSEMLGNAPKRLEHPQLVPMFIAVLIGVVVGSIPVFLPGIPAPVKLGLAGGPIIAAIVLSALGRFGRMSFYMPPSANLLLKEFGITLFLVAVGLMAGPDFAAKAMTPAGAAWMAGALAIVLIPLVATVLLARFAARMDYLAIMGLVTGSTTDPPSMSFACTLAGGEQPAVTFATVYPLTMLLRIVTAQVFVILLLG